MDFMDLQESDTTAAAEAKPLEQSTDLHSLDDTKNKEQKSETRKRIKYRVQYVNNADQVIRQYETSGPNHEDDTDVPSQGTVFEIVKTFISNRATNKAGGTTTSEEEQRYTSTAPKRTMRILSGAIVHALRSVVQFYPRQDLSTDIITIDYPYPILVHHFDELMKYRERVKLTCSEQLCYREKDAYEDLGILIAFLEQEIMPFVKEEQERIRRGFHTFDWYWVNLKPGQVFTTLNAVTNKPLGGVAHSWTGGTFECPPTGWIIHYWTLDYDGRAVGRRLTSLSAQRWDGEAARYTKIVDLRTHPRPEEVQTMIDQGKTYWRLLQKQCQQFEGKSDEFPHQKVDGLAMVDIDDYYSQNAGRTPQLMANNVDNRTWISDCTCNVCSARKEQETADPEHLFREIFPKFNTKLKDKNYFLLPRSIWAYVFKTRRWELLPVDGFSQPEFEEDLIENLVMNEKRLKTLKALAKSFARRNYLGEALEQGSWSADFVKGKGNGLIFLLHGKPGVGKTCTAECIAAYTRRPLMVLTSSDVGTNPLEVERNLTRNFKRARSWGAVLLIDEADVFMERRSTADLTRNSLVAGFLRALEFYEGILFLTTNRVGFFDDAFISRIHVQLYYPDFDDVSRRKVWQTFIDKLEKERGGYIRMTAIAKEYLDTNELKAVKWNGREIRNAFQTAVALAEYEGKKDAEGNILLTDDHLKSVVEMSRDFKDYLSELHRGDEGKRAERRYERLDK